MKRLHVIRGCGRFVAALAGPRAQVPLAVAMLTVGAARAGAQDIPPVRTEAVARIEERVLAGSPALTAGRAELEAARERAEGAGLPPPAALSAEMEDLPGGWDVTGAAYRIELGRELLTGGRGTAARSLAEAEVALARTRVEGLERRIRADVLRYLTRLAATGGIAARLAAEDTVLGAAEASLRDRFSVGQARYVDVIRLRAERLRVQTDRAEVLAEERAALEALVGLTRPEDREEIVVLSGAAISTMTPGTAALPPPPSVDSLLAISGLVLEATASVERARASRRLVVAERRPRFVPSVGLQRRVEADGRSAFGPVVGGSITLPFTAGRANRSARRAAEREVESAEAARESVVARVRGRLAGATARYEAARERLAVYDAALLRAAREERESALAAYRTGELSLVELLDFERALARAEIDRWRAHGDAVEAYADLISGATVDPSGDVE